MAFPAGTYSVTLGHSTHTSFSGTLTVTQNADGTFTASYQHGNQTNPLPVDFSFTTDPESIAFSFTRVHVNPNVKFLTAIQETNGKFGGSVTGLPSNHDKEDDTWTATASPFPGSEPGHHEHHGHHHKED